MKRRESHMSRTKYALECSNLDGPWRLVTDSTGRLLRFTSMYHARQEANILNSRECYKQTATGNGYRPVPVNLNPDALRFFGKPVLREGCM